jgi:hypothetical protein
MNLQKFLKSHPTLNYAADLAAICAPLEQLNIVYFSHAHIDKQKDMSCLATVPDFFNLYFQKGYHNFDLHMAKSGLGEEYIIWDAIQRKKQSFQLHQDFMMFNQGHTFSIVINHELGKDCYHFAAKLGHDYMNGEYLRILDNLKKFIAYFKEKVANHKQLSDAYKLKIPLSPESGQFITAEPPFNIDSFNESIKSNRSYPLVGNNYLTRRELECLSWIAKGKTMEEIAIILDLSLRTIKAHIGTIKTKLDCRNLFQLGMYYKTII